MCGVSPNLQEETPHPLPLARRNEGHGGYVVYEQGQQSWKLVMYGDCTVTSTGTN
jgi:hypothetical protein